MSRWMNMKRKIYALYKGDNFLDVGTLDELATRKKLKKNTLLFKASPTYSSRTKYSDSERVYFIFEEEQE